MNEMQLLEEFRAVVAPPDPGTLAQARARVLDGAAAGQEAAAHGGRACPAGVPKARPDRPGRSHGNGGTVALAAPGGTPSHPAAASLTARELAYRVADVGPPGPPYDPASGCTGR